MISGAVRYIYYMAIGLAAVSPLIAVFLIKRRGSTGVMPYAAGLLAFTSSSLLGLGLLQAARPLEGRQLLFALAVAFICALAEAGAIYFFMRIMLKERSPLNALAFGVGFGIIDAIVSMLNNFMYVTVAEAIVRGRYDGMLSEAQAQGAQAVEALESVAAELSAATVYKTIIHALQAPAAFVVYLTAALFIGLSFERKKYLLYVFAGIFALNFISNALSDAMWVNIVWVIAGAACAAPLSVRAKKLNSGSGAPFGAGPDRRLQRR